MPSTPYANLPKEGFKSPPLYKHQDRVNSGSGSGESASLNGRGGKLSHPKLTSPCINSKKEGVNPPGKSQNKVVRQSTPLTKITKNIPKVPSSTEVYKVREYPLVPAPISHTGVLHINDLIP